MGTETWRPVLGYEGFYEVSDHGNVRSVDRVVECRNGSGRFLRGRPKSATVSPYGYLRVRLSRDNIAELVGVHRLVLGAFVGPAPDGTECCHYDDNKLNNHLSNLRWDTHKRNWEDFVRNFGWPISSPESGHPVGAPRRDSCVRGGHAYTPENTVTTTDGKGKLRRQCRTCRNESTRARYARKRAAK